MVNFKEGTLVKGAYVVINGVKYPVIMPEYSGDTPVSPENLNKLQNDINNDVTEKYNTLNDKINGTVLYSSENGTSTDFTLTDSIANYIGKKLKIYGFDTIGREGSTEIYIRSGTVKARISLADYGSDSGNRLIQETFADLVITNNQVVFQSNSYINFTNNAYPYIGALLPSTPYVKIFRVEVTG